MPWTDKDSLRHTKRANTPHKKRLWAETANAVLRDSGDEGLAIRVANDAVAKSGPKKKGR